MVLLKHGQELLWHLITSWLFFCFHYLDHYPIDQTQKIGRRTPYVIVGTVIAAFAFMGLAYADFVQTEKIKMTDIIESHYDVAFESVEYEEEKNALVYRH